VRARQGFKAKVRKIVGNCFNGLRTWDFALITPTYANRILAPNLSRVISGWYGTREEMLRIINASLTGPSTTAGTDLNLNRHVWIQSCRDTFTLSTPCKMPVMYKLYRCTLKCKERGATSGVYVEGTLPFATGSATAAANLPTASHWDFFQQNMRTGNFTGSGVYMTTSDDAALMINQQGTYAPPIAGALWESGNNGSVGPQFHLNTPLGFIFPEMKKKLRVQCVSKGVLRPGIHKRVSFRTRMPPELRPRDYIADKCENFSPYSHFYFLRAYSVHPDFYYSTAVATNVVYAPQFQMHPAQVSILHERSIGVRSGGDSIPSFGLCLAKGATSAQGFLDSHYGLIDSGSAALVMVENTLGYYASTSRHGDTAMMCSGPTLSITSRVTDAM